MKQVPTIFAASLFALTAQAQPVENFAEVPAYKECTALAGTNPIAAEAKANEWLKVDQGVGAMHCRAMALFGQRRFAEAADALALARNKIAPENITLRTYVTRQAVQAWQEAGRPDSAIAAIGVQITELATIRGDNATEAKLTSELLLDRARIRATYGQYAEAVQDLDHAVSLAPTNEDVLLERSSAFEQLNDLSLARNDLLAVLRLNPTNAKALETQKRVNLKSASPKAL